MFFIGLFSTHIPFVVLAILYLALFPIYALRKRKSVGVSLPLVVKDDKVQVIPAQTQCAIVPTFHYEQYFSIESKQDLHNCFLFQLFGFYCFPIVYSIIPTIYTSEMWKQHLFSRPPPLIYVA